MRQTGTQQTSMKTDRSADRQDRLSADRQVCRQSQKHWAGMPHTHRLTLTPDPLFPTWRGHCARPQTGGGAFMASPAFLSIIHLDQAPGDVRASRQHKHSIIKPQRPPSLSVRTMSMVCLFIMNEERLSCTHLGPGGPRWLLEHRLLPSASVLETFSLSERIRVSLINQHRTPLGGGEGMHDNG